jgi:hypothetical protein
MNRFIIDKEPAAIAEQLCDEHIIKMILEEAQMLNTAVRIHAPDLAEEAGLYKIAYKNHPCTIWVRDNRMNYRFGVRLMYAMNKEYMYRYPVKSDGKSNTGHASMRHFDALIDAEKYMPDYTNFMTQHPQCFSGLDHLKTDEHWPVTAYRAFYKVDKSKFASYNKGRSMPQWMKGEVV